MSTNYLSRIAAIVAVAVLSAGLAKAQPASTQPGSADRPPAPATTQPGVAGQQPTAPQGQFSHDYPLAVWIAIGNRGEIMVGQFAQQHAQNQQVRDFAQSMVREHTQFDQQLRQAAMGQPGNMPAQPGTTPGAGPSGPAGTPGAAGPSSQLENRGLEHRSEASQPGSNPAGAPGTAGAVGTAGGAAGPMMGPSFDPFRLKEEIGQQKVALTERELGRHQGADFDKAYMGQQLVDHIEMLATLQAARNHATGQLRQVVDQGIQTTQQHLEHARQIMDQLTAQAPNTTARRPGEERRQ